MGCLPEKGIKKKAIRSFCKWLLDFWGQKFYHFALVSTTLENGDLGVLVYGDEGEGTLKRYLQRGNCVVLQPFNPAYNEMVIKGEDLNRLHIAGRVVETKAKW